LPRAEQEAQTYVTELYAHLLPEHLERARNAVQLPPPPQDLWRPTLANASRTQEIPQKTVMRH
jgi:hypothetical protein